MFTITKEFWFSASHYLKFLPQGHPCSNIHGHNYRVVLELCSPSLSPQGFVVDYKELKAFGDYIDAHLDHKHLNNQLDFQPSAELLAQHLYNIAHNMLGEQVSAVTVCEGPKTSATYREGSR